MIWLAIIGMVTVLAYQAGWIIDRHLQREHDRAIANAWTNASKRIEAVAHSIHELENGQTAHHVRLQRCEEWQAIKQREGMDRRRS